MSTPLSSGDNMPQPSHVTVTNFIASISKTFLSHVQDYAGQWCVYYLDGVCTQITESSARVSIRIYIFAPIKCVIRHHSVVSEGECFLSIVNSGFNFFNT